MWINAQGGLYAGDCRPGDRAATAAEILAWKDARLPTYRDLRRAAYPALADQLDAMWKGGADQDAMRAAIMAVKAKFPKPSGDLGGQ